MKIFHLPDLGEGLAEAEIREWYVKEGDTVKLDQPLLSVETAKAVVDVPSPYAGRIQKLHGKVHEIIKTGAVLVTFVGDEIPIKDQDKGSIVGRLEESQQAWHEENVIIGSSTSNQKSLRILPAVRALAKQYHVDLNAVKPSGPQGQITAEDVKRHAGLNHQTFSDGQALHGVRRMMAISMAQAHQSVAQVSIVDDVDVGHLAQDADITSYLILAMIAGVKAVPEINVWFDGNTLERKLFKEINIGIAIDSPEGLLVPVLKNAEKYSAKELRAQLERLKKEVYSRTILPEDLQGGTITLSNFGIIAGKYGTPFVMPPTVAILGCGRIYDAVIPRAGKMIISRMIPLSLTIDHRAVTGGEAARFLAAVIAFFQELTK